MVLENSQQGPVLANFCSGSVIHQVEGQVLLMKLLKAEGNEDMEAHLKKFATVALPTRNDKNTSPFNKGGLRGICRG